MKVITITRSNRAQTRALVSDLPKLHSVNAYSLTVSAPYLIEAKDMFLTFTDQELRVMLSYIEAHAKASDNLADNLKGPSTPSDSGSLV